MNRGGYLRVYVIFTEMGIELKEKPVDATTLNWYSVGVERFAIHRKLNS